MAKTLTATLETARAAGADAANRQMRAEGRTTWNVADYNLAAQTMNDLIPSVVLPEAAYYGNLARVAVNFHIQTGNPAELDCAYWYARYAVRYAAQSIR